MSQLFGLVQRASKAKSHIFALAGATAAAYLGFSNSEQHPQNYHESQTRPGAAALPRITLPGVPTSALADAPPRPAAGAGAAGTPSSSPSSAAATYSISLTGYEDVRDANGFVASALEKALRGGGRGGGRDSPLAALLGITPAATPTTSTSTSAPSSSSSSAGTTAAAPGSGSGSGSGSGPAAAGGRAAAPPPSGASVLSFGESPGPAAAAAGVDPAAFYLLLAKQPLHEKVLILDELVDSVIAEAEAGAEAAGLAVGLLGGGLACYALVGWWTDLALPGAGTVACSAVAGAAGHHRAKVAAQRTRSRFLSALLSQQQPSSHPNNRPTGLSNSFLAYLAAPTLAEKQRVAGDTPPAAFFADFYAALQPLLKQSKLEADAAGRAVLVQLD